MDSEENISKLQEKQEATDFYERRMIDFYFIKME